MLKFFNFTKNNKQNNFWYGIMVEEVVMANSEVNSKSRGNLIVFIAVAVVVLVATVIAIVMMFNTNNQKPAGTVQLSTNPSATLIINDKERVIGVKYDNQEAEILLSDTDLSGKTVEEASKIFVQLCCKAGYIDTSYDSVGSKVEIVISYSNENKIDKLKENLINTINTYFDENGVIAGAVCNKMDELKTQAETAGIKLNKYIMMQTILSMTDEYTIEELNEMTQQDLLDIIKAKANELKDIAYQYYADYIDITQDKLTQLQTQMQLVLQPIFDAIGDFEFEFTLDVTIGDLKAQINSSQLSQQLKDTVNEILDSLEETINNIKTQIQQEIEQAKATIKEESESLINESKQALNGRIELYKNRIQDHKEYFEQNKKQVQQKIQEFRNSLVA